MTPDPRITVGAVVQIDPAHDPQFGGAFLTVTEMKSFGVMGYVHAFGGGVSDRAGQAYYRVKFESIAYVGRAEWVVGR